MLALMHAHFVDGHDVRVLQGRSRRGFSAKAVDGILSREVARQNELHRHDAVEAALPRAIHDTHAAAGDFLQQLVIAEIVELHANGGSGPGQERRKVRRWWSRRGRLRGIQAER